MSVNHGDCDAGRDKSSWKKRYNIAKKKVVNGMGAYLPYLDHSAIFELYRPASSCIL